jgi:predicted GNAT superfamily acetyltransferase
LIVSRQAGGWTLGAFVSEGGTRSERLVGFVHQLAAVRGDEIFGYSHMMAVDSEFQNQGVGARLKWSQRERAIAEGRSRIRWTWDPLQARNAHFNLNRLGVTVSSYAENFYGTDYLTNPTREAGGLPGLASDRIFADWQIRSRRVMGLANAAANGQAMTINASPVVKIVIPAEWSKLVKEDPATARLEQLRVRDEFQEAFAAGLVAAGFERSAEQPRYLLFKSQDLESVLGSNA